MIKVILTLIFALLSSVIIAQKHDNIWLAGSETLRFRNFQINFSKDTFEREIKNFPERALNTYFSISDKTGGFQFFTEGHKIFNSSFQMLINGDSINYGRFWKLNSGYSATGYIIIPDVINSNRYYLLYTRLEYDQNIRSAVYCDKFQYSLIDMSEANGRGEVIEKDIELVSDTLRYHNMAAVKHGNGRDWWVPVKEFDSNEGYMFLLSTDGVILKDSFKVGKKSLAGLGQSVFTPDGTKFISYNGVDLEFGEYLDIYDFDRCSGVFSNHRQLNYLDSTVWSGGVAVSPNSRYLYLSNTLRLYQFDLWADDIFASVDTIAEYDGYADPLPSTFYLLQLAPDGKIYMSCNNGTTVWHVIHHPNEKGKACDFEQQGLKFPYRVGFGLPKFPNYRLGPLDGSPCDTLGIDNNPIAKFRWEKPDTTNPLKVSFVDLSYYEPAEWLWEFETGVISRDTSPEYTFSEAGVYDVCLTVSNANSSHRTCKTIPIGITTMSEEISLSDIKIYPNPASDAINIHLPIYFKSGSLEVFDLEGKKMFSENLTFSGNRFDISGLPQGVYAFRIKNQEAVLETGKLIIAR